MHMSAITLKLTQEEVSATNAPVNYMLKIYI
jgi:hypothetical protein